MHDLRIRRYLLLLCCIPGGGCTVHLHHHRHQATHHHRHQLGPPDAELAQNRPSGDAAREDPAGAVPPTVEDLLEMWEVKK